MSMVGKIGAALLVAWPAAAQEGPTDVREQADSVLAIMGFQTIPDGTVGELSIADANAGSTQFLISQYWLGFTVSESFPLYVEGMLSYSRYDPRFVVSDGAGKREVSARWNSLVGTFGIGWDVPIADGLVLRPIASVSVGHVASDAKLAGTLLAHRADQETLDFLENGSLDAIGYGGGVILDYEDKTPEREIDVELRLSAMRLESFDGSGVVQGSADVSNLSLWARYRAPIGDWTLFRRPVRYLLELTHSEFLGDQRDALGFPRLTSIGAGLELDASEVLPVERARAVGRFVFGENVTGFSVGLAVTF
jgi:hypothetical protein